MHVFTKPPAAARVVWSLTMKHATERSARRAFNFSLNSRSLSSAGMSLTSGAAAIATENSFCLTASMSPDVIKIRTSFSAVTTCPAFAFRSASCSANCARTKLSSRTSRSRLITLYAAQTATAAPRAAPPKSPKRTSLKRNSSAPGSGGGARVMSGVGNAVGTTTVRVTVTVGIGVGVGASRNTCGNLLPPVANQLHLGRKGAW